MALNILGGICKNWGDAGDEGGGEDEDKDVFEVKDRTIQDIDLLGRLRDINKAAPVAKEARPEDAKPINPEIMMDACNARNRTRARFLEKL